MDYSINNPHDQFAKEMFSHKEFTIIFLNEYLPNYVKEHLDFETLTLSPNSYISELLQERFSDIVFRVQMKEEH
jgi:predicted transposase/invertase (TIGR01784 family)